MIPHQPQALGGLRLPTSDNRQQPTEAQRLLFTDLRSLTTDHR